jgi:formate hydrogenlyase subunit 6/NADH:ubiquinone oxidoreductase subunit I
MTYIIAEPCIDIKDLSCVDVCPVDCIHEFERILIIDPGSERSRSSKVSHAGCSRTMASSLRS